ncbi:helix-turn-helix transcriptional regulator [Thermobifida halotolerans]|uniref:Helix-turn-helix transcriptional regulator n=1 Tax=Thermobifida halotolerans TaxID=483545 RepID=A0A399G4M8_9ACTN|nr:TetR/AcrR family transcriptional regulator [Thermobifida halotolerans]UOE20773.1 helix-turn-helix transcriptional regulator [Thermobifida halotolerans]
MTERAGGRGVVAAALRLFDERGFEATTMDDIAVAAGVSRSTLFRRFGSKDDLLFADHEELVESVRTLLAASHEDPVAAVCTAARMVLRSYTGQPDLAVRRYRLVRARPALRDRELAMTARYQSLFTQHLAGGHGDESRMLAAEVLAAAVIAAHNHVLRVWLRDPGARSPSPMERLDEALAFVVATVAPPLRGADPRPSPARGDDAVLVAVYPEGASHEEVIARVRTALESART